MKELKVDAGDGYALFKFTPPQILQAVEEGARLYLAGKKVRGLALSKGTENLFSMVIFLCTNALQRFTRTISPIASGRNRVGGSGYSTSNQLSQSREYK